MRADFTKVLTERPRAGGDKYRVVRPRGPVGEDDVGHKVGMRAPHRERKEFTDLIGPLHRFLQSRVGKPWAKVHSEICANLKGRSTQQQHLLDHLKRAVEDKLEVWPDKSIHYADGHEFFKSGRYSRADFWVDPRDGILKVRKQKRNMWRKRGRATDPNERVLPDGRKFKRLEGIWYELTTRQERLLLYEPQECGEPGQFHTASVERKRQLGSKELKSLGLSNDYLENT